MDPALLWSAVILTVVLAVRSWWAKPTIWTWIGGCSALALSGGVALRYHVRMQGPPDWARPRYVSIPLEPPGPHELQVSPLEGVSGIHVRLVARGTRRDQPSFAPELLPVTPEEILLCRWKGTLKGPPTIMEEADPSSYRLLDSFWRKDYPDALIQYEVTSQTRPILEKLELEIGPSEHLHKDFKLHWSLSELIRNVAGGVAAVALLGLVILALRRRRSGQVIAK